MKLPPIISCSLESLFKLGGIHPNQKQTVITSYLAVYRSSLAAVNGNALWKKSGDVIYMHCDDITDDVYVKESAVNAAIIQERNNIFIQQGGI